MRRILVAAGAVATLTVAGCGAATTATLDNAKLSASEVLLQTAQKADDVTSYSADVVVNFSGAQEGAGSVQGSMLYQKTPQIATDITLNQVSFRGQNLPGAVRAIVRGDVAYVKVDALKNLVGATKPWIKLDLRQLGDRAGVNVDQYLAQAQQFDLKNSVALLTASTDAKAVGTESVGGEDTTHYSGTFKVDQAAKQLPQDAQAELKSRLAEAKDVKFDAWIDGQGLPRKVELNGGVADKGTFTATVLFKGFNDAVTIYTPPADQVGEMPGRAPVGG
ncbi:LppX_LprAFG lipoprotein [Microbispora sp. RL4-1S]|uniref:LppX_LprAFG lipoprotein n=1 Tax=Microbispora oryzae TaxID=2806554 RepID=A0A940WHF5_9ACTN|nr:LppX_LprAFG lipoprotein [Microbispora oryzae]MBP2704888.1 LppX_LprAFG lipoprotein [Microbispora oryzae]